MDSNVSEITKFYQTRLGRFAERSISKALSSINKSDKGERIIGLGYCLPFLRKFKGNSQYCFAFMSAKQGVLAWPFEKPRETVLVDENNLPLGDASVDRVLLVHSLEFMGDPQKALDEIWRVLTPAGRIIIVVPNRRGIWAQFEHTPFGSGRPFSRTQLENLLRSTNFTSLQYNDALHFPPTEKTTFLRFNRQVEKLGCKFWPIFSGVTLVEAQKQMYRLQPTKTRVARQKIIPILMPQGASSSQRKDEKQPS